MSEQRFIPHHGKKAGYHAGRAGEKEAVDDPGICADLPDRKKKDQNSKTRISDESVMPLVVFQIFLLGSGHGFIDFHRIIPPRSD